MHTSNVFNRGDGSSPTRKLPRPITLGALTLLAATHSCSYGGHASGEPVGERPQPVIDGLEDKETDAVLMVGHAKMMCSGTLIAPDIVLTARHCLAAKMEPPNCYSSDPATMEKLVPTDDVLVYSADSIDDYFGEYLSVIDVLSPPGGGVDPVCGADMVAIQLAQPVTSFAPMSVRVGVGPILGESVRVVGFGNSDPQDVYSSGTRRQLPTTVDFVGERDEPNATEMVKEDFSVARGPCGGDSGGPAFDTGERMVGVMSRGNSTLCEGMVYTSAAPHRAWLTQLAKDSADRTGSDIPSWAIEQSPGSVAFGESCGSEADCESGTVCRPVEEKLLCVSLDCAACPEGSTCGEAANQPACVPTPPIGPDAGAEDGSATDSSPVDSNAPVDSTVPVDSNGPLDAQDEQATNEGNSAQAPADDGGCTLSPNGRRSREGLLWGGFGLLLFLLRRRDG